MHKLLIEIHIKREFSNLMIFVALIHNIYELFVKFILRVDA